MKIIESLAPLLEDDELELDGISSDYREVYSKIIDRTEDFTNEFGDIEFTSRADAEIAETILNDVYPNVEIKESDDEDYPFYFVYYSNEIEETKKSKWKVSPNLNPDGTPLGIGN